MQLIEDYLKRDLQRSDLRSWEEIRAGYLLRAAQLVQRDWQSPSYLASLRSEAGRREGRIVANINDYTRDKHDLALMYEQKFSKEYLPRVGILPIEPFVVSSGMAALTTIITMLHRAHGADQTILVGRHSYFQNLELLSKSFTQVILFDEVGRDVWEKLITNSQPLAVFVDSMCNESELTVPPVLEIASWMKRNLKKEGYLIVDNSMLSIGFPWKKLLVYQSRKLNILGWESLNKYYQFGLDRTTGGVVWGNWRVSVKLFYARLHAGTILSDLSTAMLPTPNRKVLQAYLARIEENVILLQRLLQEQVSPKHVKEVIRSQTPYVFSGSQLVIVFAKRKTADQIMNIIKKMINVAKREGVQLAAGTSFGMPTTRVYLTAKQTGFAQMFLRISVGTEEKEEIEKLARVIANSL